MKANNNIDIDLKQIVIDYESAEDRVALIASDYHDKQAAIRAAVKDDLDALAARSEVARLETNPSITARLAP
jgi:hypothetical protein